MKSNKNKQLLEFPVSYYDKYGIEKCKSSILIYADHIVTIRPVLENQDKTRIHTIDQKETVVNLAFADVKAILATL